MRVSSSKTSSGSASSSVGGAKPAAGSGSVAPTGGTSGSAQVNDALDVSSTSQIIAAAKVQIAAIPDVRQERVEALKVQLDSDHYHPDGEAVADGLLKEHSPTSWKQ